MPLDYSKWDAIELSDDEDFECHPNVDKKSMIRWKQAQIHKERKERQDQLDLLKMEWETSKKFLQNIPSKIDQILALNPIQIPSFLLQFGQEIDKQYTDPMRKESMSRMEKWPGNWDAPNWGEVLKNHKPWNEEINNIMKKTEDYMKEGKEIEKTGGFVSNLFKESLEWFSQRQGVVSKEVQRLEELTSKKLTMDHLVTGFDKTFVEKKPVEKVVTESGLGNKKVIETIHSPKDNVVDPFLNGVFEEMESTDQNMIDRHPMLLVLSQKGDYGTVFEILKKNPEISNEKNEEALLLRALCLSTVGKLTEAKVAVQNSMIFKFTRSLGPSGVDVFFSKLQGTGSSAQNLFFTDVKNTLEHITKRGAVLRKERNEKKENMIKAEAKKKEIYDSFLQPDGSFKLPLPDEPTETDMKQKEWFDNLPEDYKKGLLLEDVDKINAYLSSLPPEEAEYQANVAVKSGFIQFEEEENS